MIVALALTGAGAFAPRAWAGDEAAPAAVVELGIAAGDEAEGAALAQVARELLGRLSVEVRTELLARVDLAAVVAPPRAGVAAEPPLARVWIDWRAPGRATLYLVDARHDRVLVREVERPAGGEELAREELGHILETACEGLLAGGEVGEPRAGVAPKLVPPVPPPAAAVVAAAAAAPPAAGPPRLRVAVLYEAAALAPEVTLTHGPQAAVFVALGGRREPRAMRWGLWGTAQLRLPVRAADGAGAGVELQTGALRALLALERALSARATGRAGLGVGVDVARARPEAPPDAAVLDAAFTRAFAVGRAALELDVRLSPRTWLVAALAADVDVTGQRYTFTRGGGGDDVVLRPWVVRPAAALGLAFP
jgi:hypothetical protein